MPVDWNYTQEPLQPLLPHAMINPVLDLLAQARQRIEWKGLRNSNEIGALGIAADGPLSVTRALLQVANEIGYDNITVAYAERELSRVANYPVSLYADTHGEIEALRVFDLTTANLMRGVVAPNPLPAEKEVAPETR